MLLDIKLSVEEKGKSSPRWEVERDSSGALTLQEIMEFLKTALIQVSGEALKEEQAKGFDKNPLILVDKREKPVTSVSPFGRIDIISRADMAVALLDMYDFILARSPVMTGQYISSHVVLAERQIIARDRKELEDWIKNTSDKSNIKTYHFINLMPYAGMLERESITSKNRGMHGKVKMVKSRDKRKRAADANGMVRAPNGAYFLAHRAFKNKYKSLLAFFQFTPLKSFGISAPLSGHVNGKKLRGTFAESNKKYKGPYVYPTIRLVVREGGSLSE